MEIYYNLGDSTLGTFGLIWRMDKGNIKIIEIFLPTHKTLLLGEIKKYHPTAKKSNSLEELTRDITNFISGEKIKFNLDLLDFDNSTDFEKGIACRL